MKKICIIVFAILCYTSVAFGDEVDRGLSNIATKQIMNSTRQMIRAGIESDEAVKMTRLMLENRFREENTLRAHKIIMNACKKGLPAEPIMNKAYEGIAKHIQPRNVIQAMEQTHSRYVFAYEKAGKLTQENTQMRHIGDTIAKGLAAGMAGEDVERIMNRLQQRIHVMTKNQANEFALETFTAARIMASRGVSSKAATDVVCQALQHQYSATEMKMMSKSFMNQSRHSEPNTLAKSYSEAIQMGRSAESLGASSSKGASGSEGGPGGGGHGGGGHGGGGSGGSGGGGGGH